MRLLLLFTAIGSLTAFCLAETVFAQDAAQDLAKLQGIWKLESGLDRGESLPADVIERLKFTFKDNQLIPSDNPKEIVTITLDPSKKPHATIDIKEKDMKVNLGIYELKDDTFRLCFTEAANRPTEFSSTKDSKTIYLVLKRVPKAK